MENANHTIFIQFQKTIEKKNGTSFCGYLNQIKQSGDKKKTMLLFFGKNVYHTISIYENCMTSIFSMATTKIFQNKIEIAPKFFCFFFQPQIEFFTQTNTFQKTNFACNFVFCIT